MDDIMARRGKLEIYRDILESLSGGPKIASWITDDAHLNFARGSKRIEGLRERGLLGKEGKEYHLTEEGERALELFEEMEDMMGDLMYRIE